MVSRSLAVGLPDQGKGVRLPGLPLEEVTRGLDDVASRPPRIETQLKRAWNVSAAGRERGARPEEIPHGLLADLAAGLHGHHARIAKVHPRCHTTHHDIVE